MVTNRQRLTVQCLFKPEKGRLQHVLQRGLLQTRRYAVAQTNRVQRSLGRQNHQRFALYVGSDIEAPASSTRAHNQIQQVYVCRFDAVRDRRRKMPSPPIEEEKLRRSRGREETSGEKPRLSRLRAINAVKVRSVKASAPARGLAQRPSV